MGRAIQDARIILDQCLRSVSMMNIKVDDGDARQAVMVKCIARGDSYISKQAKPHGRITFGMMTRGTNGGKGICSLTRHNDIHAPNDCSDRSICSG
jgi:hypothetical protein